MFAKYFPIDYLEPSKNYCQIARNICRSEQWRIGDVLAPAKIGMGNYTQTCFRGKVGSLTCQQQKSPADVARDERSLAFETVPGALVLQAMRGRWSFHCRTCLASGHKTQLTERPTPERRHPEQDPVRRRRQPKAGRLSVLLHGWRTLLLVRGPGEELLRPRCGRRDWALLVPRSPASLDHFLDSHEYFDYCSPLYGSVPHTSRLEDLGCFYEDITLRSWSSGRSYCQVIGGDMAVFDTSTDFLRLADYYSAQTTVTGIWVGVYNRVWLSGRTPSSSEWYSSEPNGSDLCVDLRSGYGFLLGDTGCSIGHMTLCKAY
ncbi:uncharacterized protein LOC119592363 [Penaeus monodon]|uniref:uncharacterized protein LOC119592363 n=1 Tax=Penaeus monodon TaxID=6687 RepID=UPI0018A7B290|nr:uncharacterized protein LOC119592363 [Penaeus monodon]